MIGTMGRVFVDANIPTYAAGREHPLKEPCKEILELVASYPRMFCTDAEVLQELLHRYLSLRRWPEGKQIISDFATLMRGSVEAVHDEDVLLGAELVSRLLTPSNSETNLAEFGLEARDLLHIAVMMRTGSSRIVTADKDFDGLGNEGIKRLDPAKVKHWRAGITDTDGNGA